MQNTSCLLETEYFPTTWFFAQCLRFERIILEASEHYQKRSYRNRSQISGPNGTFWLSVPLRKGKNRQCPIREVEIAFDEPWQSNHWHSIRTSYGKAPFFDHYADLVRILVYRQDKYLFERNLAIINAFLSELGLSRQIWLSQEFHVKPKSIVDLRGINTLSTSPGQLAIHFPEYPQPFSHRHPFHPNLSILDILFCKGPETALYLEKVAAHFN